MLQILQARDYKRYSSVIEKLSLGDTIVSVVEAVDKDEIIGFGVYHYADDRVVLDVVEANGDLYLYDGIVRSILFLAINNGIEKSEFSLEDNSTAQKLGFVQNNHKYLDDLSDFLNNCKSCRK